LPRLEAKSNIGEGAADLEDGADIAVIVISDNVAVVPGADAGQPLERGLMALMDDDEGRPGRSRRQVLSHRQ
jgi:hypothetical protein